MKNLQELNGQPAEPLMIIGPMLNLKEVVRYRDETSTSHYRGPYPRIEDYGLEVSITRSSPGAGFIGDPVHALVSRRFLFLRF